jgi:hypothetical protein
MLKVFVSYAREDEASAIEVYDWLKSIGCKPWLDQRDILPGQNWEAEIDRALAEANCVLLLMSPNSVSKRGFVQREANEAIKNLQYKLPTDVYMIPVVLVPCEIPAHVSSKVQYITWSLPDAKSRVSAALALAAQQQAVVINEGVEFGPFKVLLRAVAEEWAGLPGHDISISYPEFTSVSLSQQAQELSSLFAGRTSSAVIEARQKTWEQDAEHFQDREHARSNGRWDDFHIAYASDTLLSVVYNVGWYGAGAAHPNSHFETFNFSLAPHLTSLNLSDFFVDFGAAVDVISRECISQLRREYWQRCREEPDSAAIDWISSGAGPEAGNFQAFSVADNGLDFHFAPYQVSAYALGSWSVRVAFYDLLACLKDNGALGKLGRIE